MLGESNLISFPRQSTNFRARFAKIKPLPFYNDRIDQGCRQSDTLPSTLADFSFFTLTILTDRSVERRSGPLNVCCL